MNIEEKILLVKGLNILKNTIQTGSFSKTAEKLHARQSNISTKLHELEDHLGIKLFSKTSHGVIPTHEGIELNGYAEKIDALFYEICNYSQIAHSISGDLKLWATDGLCLCMMPHIAEFQQKYPDVCIEVICSNEMPKFGARDADVALVYSEPDVTAPVVCKKFDLRFGLFASPSYIAKHGKPADMDDFLKNHRICDRSEYINTWDEWREIIKRAKNVVSCINNTNLLIQATKEGMGIALHPLAYGRAEKDLVEIDIGLHLKHSCWLVSHYDAKDTVKIKKLLECIEHVMCNL